MNKKILSLSLLFALAGCQAPKPPVPTDDTIVSSTVSGVKLTYRHVVQPPAELHPLNLDYRALYNTSVMSSPNYSGKLIKYLSNGQHFMVLGIVDKEWLAVSDQPDKQLIGYVPLKAGVESSLYDGVVNPARRRAAPRQCVKVNGDTQACRQGVSATWVIK